MEEFPNEEEVPCALENPEPPVTIRRQDMMEELRCPVCAELCTPQIYSCQNGHQLCNICWERLSICPQCKAERGARNIFAERFFESHVKLCQYNSNGCRGSDWIENSVQFQSHEDNCKYRNINCWIPNCTSRLIGPEALAHHWGTQHEISDLDCEENSVVVIVNPENVYQPKAFHLKRDGNSFLGIVEICMRNANEVSCLAYVYGYSPRDVLDFYKYTITIKYQENEGLGNKTESWTGLVHHESVSPAEISQDERFYRIIPTIPGNDLDPPHQTFDLNIKISTSQPAVRSRQASLQM